MRICWIESPPSIVIPPPLVDHPHLSTMMFWSTLSVCNSLAAGYSLRGGGTPQSNEISAQTRNVGPLKYTLTGSHPIKGTVPPPDFCDEQKVSSCFVLCPDCIIEDALEALAMTLADLPGRVAAAVRTAADVDMADVDMADVDMAHQCEPFYILSSS